MIMFVRVRGGAEREIGEEKPNDFVNKHGEKRKNHRRELYGGGCRSTLHRVSLSLGERLAKAKNKLTKKEKKKRPGRDGVLRGSVWRRRSAGSDRRGGGKKRKPGSINVRKKKGVQQEGLRHG